MRVGLVSVFGARRDVRMCVYVGEEERDGRSIVDVVWKIQRAAIGFMGTGPEWSERAYARMRVCLCPEGIIMDG
jgi:hypothetical protein